MKVRLHTIAATLLAFACQPRTAATTPAPALPSPVLELAGDSTFRSQGATVTQYRLRITNYAAFPDSLFEPAPTLPPCGTNTLASRTWAEIYDRFGRRVYGHCGIVRNSGLTSLLFSRRGDVAGDDSVFVMLVDRKTGRSYRSNLVSLARERR